MTFLELCQMLATKCGISGTIVAVTNQVGELGRVVNWIGEAYQDIQTEHSEWSFLRSDVVFDTQATIAGYTSAAAGVTGFGAWCFDNGWRCYNKATGTADEQPVYLEDYDAFRNVYLYGTNRTSTRRPQVVTQKPDESLLFWPIPDAVYTVVGEYYAAPKVMAASTDTPVFASEYHMAIVHLARMKYAEYEGDASLFTTAAQDYNRVLAKMESRYLPKPDTPEPMA